MNDVNNIDMSNMSPYEISMVFSCIGANLPYVWESFENGDIQLYTTIHPKYFNEECAQLFQMFQTVSKDWKFWDDIEVYTIKLTESNAVNLELTCNHLNLKIKKGLI